ncbi:MAG: nitrogen regulation protein NR(II) [Desulfococcaceae bacterium]
MTDSTLPETDSDFYHKLKWLMFFRVLFTTLLLGSTIVLQVGEDISSLSRPMVVLYELIAGLYFLSFIYTLLLPRTRQLLLFAYIQIFIDTCIVTLIIFLTGSFSSLFSFLYLVVIIYASMLLFRKGSMIMAAVCSIQYGILMDLEYYGIFNPFGMDENLMARNYEWSFVLYKILIIMVACFAVAFLSGFLAEYARKKEKELAVMEAQVKRVEKMAAIGEMAAGLAHEIKNPLASLRGSIQLLQESGSPDPDNEILMQIILREADRLNSLVSDFLLFARPPAGKPERIDLGRTLHDIVTIFENDRKNCMGVTISRNIDQDVWTEMDADHLRQICWNILLNAAESITDKGHIEIRMNTIKENRDRYAIITIRDNGCGIPENILSTVFDPFVTTKKNGTGLGLSIVYRIMESYKNRMDVESEVGKGTVFTLRFRQTDPPVSAGDLSCKC